LPGSPTGPRCNAEFLERTLAKEPDSVPDMLKLSRAYGALGQYEKAVRVLERDPGSTENAFQQTNRWMLDTALALDGGQLTLIALWDGADGDGAGGTGDMVRRAAEAGARIVRINPLDFLGR